MLCQSADATSAGAKKKENPLTQFSIKWVWPTQCMPFWSSALITLPPAVNALGETARAAKVAAREANKVKPWPLGGVPGCKGRSKLELVGGVISFAKGIWH